MFPQYPDPEQHVPGPAKFPQTIVPPQLPSVVTVVEGLTELLVEVLDELEELLEEL